MSNESRSDDFVDSFIASAFASGDSSTDSLDPEFLFEEEQPERIGRFRVVERIGAGGVGVVFRVEDPELGREVAVKVLRAPHAKTESTVDRFREEARVCGRLTHPGVVTIHEVGELEDGRPYIAMKLVDGETLASILTQRGFGRGGRGGRGLIEIFEKVCQTTAYAHGRGIVHGDLKPQNVMVGAFGEVQVMDWGFARGEEDSGDEHRGGGTPAYMAPEQSRRSQDQISKRTDVFGLGAILCEILTGAPPYLGETREEVYLRAREGWQDDLHARLDACDADERLVELARACLEPDPEHRPEDAGRVADAVVAFQGALADRARKAEIEAAEANAVAHQERRARRLTVGLSLSIAVAVLVAASSFVWLQHEASARALDAQRAVDAEIATARAALAEAEHRGPDAAQDWNAVLSAVGRARELAASRDASDALSARVETEITNLELEAEEGLRSLALAAELDDLRPHKGNDRVPAAHDDAFAAAFARIGITSDTAIEDAVAIVRASRIRDDVIAALDQWSRFRRSHALGGEGGWRRLADIARRADDDAWRNELREAYFSGDRAGLMKLAERIVAGERRAPDSIDLLGWSLLQVGQREAALRLYRHAVREHPDDYDLVHNLGSALEYVGPDAPLEEIARLFWIGVALRPESAHASNDLGFALINVGRVEDGLAFIDRGIELGSSHPRSQFLRGVALERLGRVTESCEAYGKAARGGFPTAWLPYGSKLDELDRPEEAVEALRIARRIAPQDAGSLFQLGRVLSRLRRNDESIPLLEEALRLDSQIAEAWCNLGHAYLWVGRFVEGVEALRRGHELGQGYGGMWPYPSAEWVAFGESLIVANRRLEEIRGGLAESAGPIEDWMLAQVAMRRGLDATAYDMFRSALAEPQMIPPQAQANVHLEGAIAAVRAAAVVDGPASDEIRARALRWFEAFERDEPYPDLLRNWRYEPEVARLRAALEARPEADPLRERWNALDRKLQARIDALHRVEPR